MKRFLALAVMALAHLCVAQVVVNPISQPHQTFVDSSGSPCALCKLYTYAAGTTTPQPTYANSAGSVQHSNPIVLDVAGGASIWTAVGVSYKFVLIDASGSTIWSVDSVLDGRVPCTTAGAIQYANGTGTGLACDSSVKINATTHQITASSMLATEYISAGSGVDPTQGAVLMWNKEALSPGETDFVNYKGTGAGGFRWYNLVNGDNPSLASPIAKMDPAGKLSVSGLISAATVSAGGGADPTQGAFLAWNSVGGSGRTDFINYKGSGAGGFNWFNLANGVTPVTPIASMDPSGNLTVNNLTAANVCYSNGTQCSGAGLPSTTNVLRGDGSGGASDSGVVTTNICQKNGNDCNGIDFYWDFTTCANGTGQPSRCQSTFTLPGGFSMPDYSYSIACSVNSGSFEPSDQIITIHQSSLPTGAGGTVAYSMVQVMQNGTSGGVTFTASCHAHHQ